ncbi:hypothetical protein SRHO_G00310230 [Serrasalmus rhombeus]
MGVWVFSGASPLSNLATLLAGQCFRRESAGELRAGASPPNRGQEFPEQPRDQPTDQPTDQPRKQGLVLEKRRRLSGKPPPRISGNQTRKSEKTASRDQTWELGGVNLTPARSRSRRRRREDSLAP